MKTQYIIQKAIVLVADARIYLPPICNAESFVANLDVALFCARIYQWPTAAAYSCLMQQCDWQIVLNTENRCIELATPATYGYDPETSIVLLHGDGLGQSAINYPITGTKLPVNKFKSFGQSVGRELALSAMLDLRCGYNDLTDEAVAVAAEILSQVLTDMEQTTFPFADGAACNAIN